MVDETRVYCTWCGAPVIGGQRFCAACGRPVSEPVDIPGEDADEYNVSGKLNQQASGNSRKLLGGLVEIEPKGAEVPHQMVWTVVTVIIVIVVVAGAVKTYQGAFGSDDATFRQTPDRPCEGWLAWQAQTPDVSLAFPIHGSILEGRRLSKDQYSDWLDIARSLRSDLDDAKPAPYALREYVKQADIWLTVMDRILYDLSMEGELTVPTELRQLDYNNDQMGIAWGNALLECPPSART